ncbi:hypothetical protein Lepto7375DRAFT_3733 [Leptolyngbya sp. PCC 7375]|nr:hypothetical protein Lepto7375DRAFT_3733 [Leptolyngbya sp. PCC 7375]
MALNPFSSYGIKLTQWSKTVHRAFCYGYPMALDLCGIADVDIRPVAEHMQGSHKPHGNFGSFSEGSTEKTYV